MSNTIPYTHRLAVATGAGWLLDTIGAALAERITHLEMRVDLARSMGESTINLMVELCTAYAAQEQVTQERAHHATT